MDLSPYRCTEDRVAEPYDKINPLSQRRCAPKEIEVRIQEQTEIVRSGNTSRKKDIDQVLAHEGWFIPFPPIVTSFSSCIEPYANEREVFIYKSGHRPRVRYALLPIIRHKYI